MKAILAGFNLDKTIIDKIDTKDIATPETISAAYARISRSKKSVTELREEAKTRVKKARKSNEKIIFEMGHSSIAEHAVFNFDIIGISRFLVEYIEKSRLASFTEKSQRYVTLSGDYVIPPELENTELKDKFTEIIQKQNKFYQKLTQKAIDYLKKNEEFDNTKALDEKAKEDARYILPLATETQLGLTINARSLVRMLRRLDTLELAEAKNLKKQFEEQIKDIAPSLIRYTKADEFEKNYLETLPYMKIDNFIDKDFRLLEFTEFGEEKILAAMMFQRTGLDYSEVLNLIKNMSPEQKERYFSEIFRDLKSYHSVPRAFELAQLKFYLKISSSCFAQLKRHRMSTILHSNYNPNNGYIIPPLIKEINQEDEFDKIIEETNDLFYDLEDLKEGLGNYILTNSHILKVIFSANLRELYHFSRLRSDKHAQWEIRKIAQKINETVKEEYPAGAKFMMGKDKFEETKK